MVNIKTYINKKLVCEDIVSNSFIEYFYVKNAINYISKNISNSKKPIELYKEYIKSIAVQKNNSNCNSVINKLEVWINKTFVDNMKKDICIVCNNENEWISM